MAGRLARIDAGEAAWTRYSISPPTIHSHDLKIIHSISNGYTDIHKRVDSSVQN
jgi:hypothetical protein